MHPDPFNDSESRPTRERDRAQVRRALVPPKPVEIIDEEEEGEPDADMGRMEHDDKGDN